MFYEIEMRSGRLLREAAVNLNPRRCCPKYIFRETIQQGNVLAFFLM